MMKNISEIWKDTRKCAELVFHFGELEDYGEEPSGWTPAQILQEARECLELYESSGTAADRCADNNKQAIRERNQLRRFVAKWSKVV